MIVRELAIHDWKIVFLFAFEEEDLDSVVEVLRWAHAPEYRIFRVEDKVRRGGLDTGFCFSNPRWRRTVFAIGLSSSGPEVLDSVVHEIIHITQHIAQEDDLDPYGEDVAYLGGDISRAISDVVCELSCPHCNRQ